MHRFLPLLLLTFLGACAGVKPVTEAPRVTMNSVAISSVSFTGAEGQVSMDVFNPNGYGLPLTRVDWKLSIGGAQPVTGNFKVSKTIPAKASAPVEGRLRIGASSAMSMARMVGAGANDYSIAAVLYFQSRFGEISLELTHEGELEDAARVAKR